MFKKILITIIILTVIGLGIYFFYGYSPENEISRPLIENIGAINKFQGNEYRIFGITVEGGGRKVICDVIADLSEEEEIKSLAQKIIDEIVGKDKKIREIELFFYRDFVSAGVDNCDLARIVWLQGELELTMIENN